MVKITIIVDNEVIQSSLRSDWGFSCLVEIEKRRLLFDTGANGDMLIENMEKLKIDPSEIDTVFLSHNHWDHTGGLPRLLEINRDVKVYRPEFCTEPTEFLPNLISTGMLANIEQSLIMKTSKGLVVIGGCSHPGLENILKVVHNLGKVYAVLGGFHGFNKFDALKGVSLILPCHCTQHKQEILDIYPNTSTPCGAGKIIEI